MFSSSPLFNGKRNGPSCVWHGLLVVNRVHCILNAPMTDPATTSMLFLRIFSWFATSHCEVRGSID